jgi:hypothetical protein
VIADRGIDASGTGIAELPVDLKVSASLDLSGTGITTLPDESAGGFTGSSRQRLDAQAKKPVRPVASHLPEH